MKNNPGEEACCVPSRALSQSVEDGLPPEQQMQNRVLSGVNQNARRDPSPISAKLDQGVST
jgi:hypothetical protein